MNLIQAKEDFKRHLTVKGWVKATLGSYERVLGRLLRFLGERKVEDTSQVTKAILGDFQEAEKERLSPKGLPLAIHTVNTHLLMVRLFFRYLREEGVLWSDPAREMTLMKEPKTLPRTFLTSREAGKILGCPDTTTALGYRDRCILEVLYSTGIRRSELNNLKVADLDLEGGFLRVNQGKGGKDRVVPLGRVACRYLTCYLASVRPMFLRKDPGLPWLFISKKGGRMSSMVARGVVRRYTQAAGVMKKVTPHTFRHTCATLMLKNRANIRHVQELLGHASLETTKVYTAVTVTDLKEIHRKCHPRERSREV
jgi:integrase/recombinase XerD